MPLLDLIPTVCAAWLGRSPLHCELVKGGFSGAAVFRLRTAGEDLCLKAWPSQRVDLDRLRWIHAEQARAARCLKFVPRLRATILGETVHQQFDRSWELSDWMPGAADFHGRPTQGRLRAAMAALAKLHNVWSAGRAVNKPCPAAQRCSERLQLWRLETEGRIRAALQTADHPLLEHLASLPPVIRQVLPRVEAALLPLLTVEAPAFPVLRDVWHDHVLFVENEVSGLVDYGGVAVDSPCADLARLLGSLIGDDVHQLQTALDAYHGVRPLSASEQLLVPLLDRAGAVVALINWLDWLLLERRPYDDWSRLERRIDSLRRRVELWEDRITAPILHEP